MAGVPIFRTQSVLKIGPERAQRVEWATPTHPSESNGLESRTPSIPRSVRMPESAVVLRLRDIEHSLPLWKRACEPRALVAAQCGDVVGTTRAHACNAAGVVAQAAGSIAPLDGRIGATGDGSEEGQPSELSGGGQRRIADGESRTCPGSLQSP